jgi:hypothetical protein
LFVLYFHFWALADKGDDYRQLAEKMRKFRQVRARWAELGGIMGWKY